MEHTSTACAAPSARTYKRRFQKRHFPWSTSAPLHLLLEIIEGAHSMPCNIHSPFVRHDVSPLASALSSAAADREVATSMHEPGAGQVERRSADSEVDDFVVVVVLDLALRV